MTALGITGQCMHIVKVICVFFSCRQTFMLTQSSRLFREWRSLCREKLFRHWSSSGRKGLTTFNWYFRPFFPLHHSQHLCTIASYPSFALYSILHSKKWHLCIMAWTCWQTGWADPYPHNHQHVTIQWYLLCQSH